MKQLLIAFVCFAFVGCGHEVNVKKDNSEYYLWKGDPLQVVVIDSCQYLYQAAGNASMLTHKGNCNNPIHSKH